MFIKKDLRKIPEMLADAAARAGEGNEATNDNAKDGKALRSLHLAKRPDEFQGTIRVLCQPESPSAAALLQKLESLSLYDCSIRSLDGIGKSMPNLQDLSVGRNPLARLPPADDMGQLVHLKRLWLDDCQLSGPLPDCLLELSSLQELRVSNNHITELPDELHHLADLRVLCVDCNRLGRLPPALPGSLTVLQVRENQLTSLPPLPLSLQLLHASSNEIDEVEPPSGVLAALTHVYLNRNRLTSVPDLFASAAWCPKLSRLNLSNNAITDVSAHFVTAFGKPDPASGICNANPSTVVLLVDNPVVQALASEAHQVDMEVEREMAQELEDNDGMSVAPTAAPMVTA